MHMDEQNETNSCNQHHTKESPHTHCKGCSVGPRTILDEYGEDNLLNPLGFKIQTIQPIASHYTNYANQLDIYTYTM